MSRLFARALLAWSVTLLPAGEVVLVPVCFSGAVVTRAAAKKSFSSGSDSWVNKFDRTALL